MRVVIVALMLMAPLSAWAEDCERWQGPTWTAVEARSNCRIANALELIAERMK